MTHSIFTLTAARELIFTEEKILVSPSLDEKNDIIIIVQVSETKSYSLGVMGLL